VENTFVSKRKSSGNNSLNIHYFLAQNSATAGFKSSKKDIIYAILLATENQGLFLKQLKER
jgi:hypothetical protein